MSWKVSIKMDPSLVAVRRAAHVFKAAIGDFGTHELRQELELAFVEACTNSAVHGPKGRGKPEILATITIDPAELEIVIQDGGKPFDPFQKERQLDLDDVGSLPCGGFGLSLIRRICDTVEYHHNEQGNLLRLRKSLSSSCDTSLALGRH